MDFGEITNPAVKEKISNVQKSVERIRHMLDITSNKKFYDQLSTMDKVNYDLFLSYSLNTLYWLYLRTKGMDPCKNDIKNELNRVREYMIKAKQAHDRKTIRPKLDVPASKRFIKHGLWESSSPQPNKKIKFK